jgi:hypothetical protein
MVRLLASSTHQPLLPSAACPPASIFQHSRVQRPRNLVAHTLLRSAGVAGDGTLSLEDFEPIMNMIIFKSNNWQESVVAKLNWARALSLKVVLVPMVAGYVSSALISSDSPYAGKAPGYLTSVIDLVSKYTLLF